MTQIDAAFVQGESLLSLDRADIHVHYPASSPSEAHCIKCTNTIVGISCCASVVTAVHSKDKPVKLYALAGHLLAKEQQRSLGDMIMLLLF